jgi:hypothetical protein
VKTVKAWVGPEGGGLWTVDAAQYEELWKRADWDTKRINDPRRADAEWAKLYGTK